MSVAADVLQTKKSKGTLLTGSPCLAVVGHTEWQPHGQAQDLVKSHQPGCHSFRLLH